MVLSIEHDIHPILETDYLKDQGVRTYLEAWCQVNDEILPIFLPREEWQQRIKEVSGWFGQAGERVVMYLPEDMKVWEMLTAVNVLDQGTFTNPEKAKEIREQLKEAIAIFRQAGIYLKTYAQEIDWGDEATKVFVQDLATEFYQFGRSLTRRRKVENTFEDIPTLELDDEDKLDVEEQLIGLEFMRKRYLRLENRLGRPPTPEEIEAERKRIVKVFFEALNRDFAAQKEFEEVDGFAQEQADWAWKEYVAVFMNNDEDELSTYEVAERKRLEEKILPTQPWHQLGPQSALILNAFFGLRRAFATPRFEFENAIFRRGKKRLLENLKAVDAEPDPNVVGRAVNNLLSRVGWDVQAERKILAEKVNVVRFKQELEELKTSGAETREVVKKELGIVAAIQKEVSKFTYSVALAMPADIQRVEKINCVGANLVSGMLLDEIGIKYLAGGVEGHAVMVVVTSDNELHFRDMRVVANNTRITTDQMPAEEIDKVKTFARLGKNHVLHTQTNPDWYKVISLGTWLGTPFLDLYQPEIGLQAMVMNNFAAGFLDEGGNLTAEVAPGLSPVLELYLDQVPDDAFATMWLANCYIKMGNLTSASLNLMRLEQLAPEQVTNYALWSSLFMEKNQPSLAIESLRHALMNWPQYESGWRKLMAIHKDQGDDEKYLETCFQARLFVNFVGFTDEIVNYYLESGQPDKAEAQAQLLVERLPDDVRLWGMYYGCRIIAHATDESIAREAFYALLQLGEENRCDAALDYLEMENPNAFWTDDLVDAFNATFFNEVDFDIPVET